MRVTTLEKWCIGLGMSCLAIHWLAPPSVVEIIHGKGVFPLISWILDHSINLLPISVLYILLPILPVGLYRLVVFLRRFPYNKRTAWFQVLIRSLSFVSATIFVFYLFWGFNYDRIQLSERLTWRPAQITSNQFLMEANDQVDRLKTFSRIERDAIEANIAFKHYRLLETVMRNEAIAIADSLKYLRRTGVRCRQLIPKGLLLRISTAGFYNPITGECNIDKGLHPLQKPFVMAHEFFHGMGVTGEGDCNFLAYVLCHQSDVDYIRYSGELCYWRYMRYTLRHTDPALYEQLINDLPDFVVADLESIDHVIQKYPDIAPHMRDAIYNAYLRSNKIEDGMANYNRILQMVMNWRQNDYQLH